MNNTINHVINQSKIVDLKVPEGFVYIDYIWKILFKPII